MKTLLHYYKRIFASTVFLILSIGNVYSQNLMESRKSSFYTYYYQISNEEAKMLFRGEDSELEYHNYFHTLVDSTLTDSVSDISLAQGHYLKVFVEESNLKFDLLTITNYDVRILNNSSDLQIKVYDSLGNIIDHARVSVKNRKVPFDKKTSSYMIKKTNKQGFAEVQVYDLISYHHLERKYNNSWLRRSSRKVLYKTPVKYIIMPVSFVISLPIDGVKSIIHGYTYGTIHTVKRFFVNSYESIACIFDDYHCQENYNIGDQYKSFFVFNKPKYRPKDTVKFKAFVIDKKGKPIKDDIQIVFKKAYNKEIPISGYTNYRPGGFTGEFVLHDSLEIELDKYYYVELLNDKEQTVLSKSFKYEDYELGKLNLKLTAEDKQFRGQSFEISISGKDENDLNILDGRLEITLKLNETFDFFSNQVFVPDTLLHKDIPLEPDQDTQLHIPDSIFPAANLNYNIDVKLLTSDNETLNSSKNIDYYYSNEEIGYELDQDSITVFYTKNGIRKEKEALISGVDAHGNEFDMQQVQLPYKDRINNYYSKYLAQTDSMQKYLFLNNESPNLQLYSSRTYDSLFIDVSNPRDIPFTYFIYKNNHEIERGYDRTLKHSRKVNTKSNYYVSLQYLWAGEVKEDNYEIIYDKTKLKIEVDQPKLAYPGQKIPVKITVKDHKGRPVPDIDLTAYGLTKKFNYNAPSVPDFYENKKHRATINTFSLKDESISNAINLPYDQWESIAALDTIEYFDFIYPGDSIYRFSYETLDNNTQFAPYVLDKGRFVPVRVIYVDNRPVYFNWMSQEQPYSFPIIYGRHEIKIRTLDKLITIKGMHFEYGQKHIFSLNEDLELKNISIREMPKSFTENEKNTLSRYIMSYRHINSNNLAYLRQGEQVHLLNTATSGNYYRTDYLIGPISPQKVHFNILDSYDMSFQYEPHFEYEFQKELLKMRSVEKNRLFYDRNFYAQSAVKALDELYMTEYKAKERWRNILNERRRNNLYNRYDYSTDNGRIKIEATHPNDSFDILNTALIKKDDSEFLRLYSGFPSLYHGLETGQYQLIVFSSDEKYALLDSLEARKNGLNFYKVGRLVINEKDSFSSKIHRLIQNMAIRNEFLYVQEHDKNKFLKTYRERYTYFGEGNMIQGRVFDESGEPLPGVNVIVKGTTYGTVTDIDGYYSIKAPYDAKLVFSFVGFVQKEVEVGNKMQVDQMLTPDVQQLSEVVVIGYGVTKKSNLTGSVSTVRGRAAGVMVRGVNTTTAGSEPLLIIDGKPYMGSMDDLDESLIADMEVIHDSSATALYGARAANGVVIIDTKGGTRFKKPAGKGMPGDDAFMESVMQASSIRDNFRDYAFWQPQLVTDENGKVSFETTLPDDVTNWGIYILGMNDQKQSGQIQSEIKSFKPVMAQLNLPRFLTVGDSSIAIGKSLNYTADSIDVSTHFELNGNEKFAHKKSILHSEIDSLEISPVNTDTLKAKYYLKKSDGYFDGEEREIPVFPVGLENTAGQFFVLDNDTTIDLNFVDSLGDVHIYAHASEIDALQEEIKRLVDYPYACNEQMASKLMGLLALQMITESQGEKFDKEGEVKKLIKKLLKNQNAEGLWGWWDRSQSLEWVSEQVVEALMLAKKNGYDVGLDLVNIEEHLTWKLESGKSISDRLKYLRIAQLLDIENIDYKRHIYAIDTVKKKSLLDRFQLTALKQAFNLPYSLDSIITYQKNTLFGNVYFEDEKENNFRFWTRPTVLTLTAYQALKNDSSDHSQMLRKIRHYFLENKGRGCFINTYETARIVHAILPDMLKGADVIAPPELEISGSLTKLVKSFPFDTTMTADSQISIRKSGAYPIYFTSYQRYWNTSPTPYADQFEIDTHFENDKDSLKAGEAIKMIVNVKMEKEAEYLVIEVPIPAGCSYETKNQSYREVHREYFRNKAGICLRSLPKGEHTFTIELIPRYSGKYTLNPAKVEMMYFPTFYSNNGLKRVEIW